MKKLIFALCLLVSSFLLVGNANGRQFTFDEVIDIYYDAHDVMGDFGTLSREVDTSPHKYFKLSWEVHYLHYYMEGCNLALRIAHTNITGGYSFTLYVFIDYDFDGKVDYAERRFYNVIDDEGTMTWPEYPEELNDKINEWALNIPNAQEMYEKELAFWQNELRGEKGNAN